MNLNGQWQFEIDHGASGRARGLIDRELTGTITVPSCPESKLSGVEYKDFMAAVWYRRTFTLPQEAEDKRVLPHSGFDGVHKAALKQRHLFFHSH